MDCAGHGSSQWSPRSCCSTIWRRTVSAHSCRAWWSARYHTPKVLLLLLTLLGLEILYQLVLHDVSTEAKETLHHLEEVEVTLMVSHCLTVVLPGGHWAACRPSSSTDKLTVDELTAVGQGQNSSSALPRQHDNYTLNWILNLSCWSND